MVVDHNINTVKALTHKKGVIHESKLRLYVTDTSSNDQLIN